MMRVLVCYLGSQSSITDSGPRGAGSGMEDLSRCQHCERKVSWSRSPEDAGWPAFTHDETNTVACPWAYDPALGIVR